MNEDPLAPVNRCVEDQNADFYPVPVEQISKDAKGREVLPRRRGGYLTRQEFVALYDAAGQVLHMRNPFSTRDPLETIQYTELEYANRIQNLLSRHVTRMVDGKTAWIVNVPGSGPVKMLPAKVEV